MRFFAGALQSVAVTLWVGGMWTIGFVVTPLLFARMPERVLAGLIAGRLFTLVAYIGIVCALVLLFFQVARYGAAAVKQGNFWLVLLMLALVLVGEFGVQPVLESLRAQALPKEVMASIFRGRFNTWHGVASGLYVIDSLLGLVLVVRHHKQK